MVNRTLDKYALMINKIMINVKLAERTHSYIKSLGHKMSVDTNLTWDDPLLYFCHLCRVIGLCNFDSYNFFSFINSSGKLEFREITSVIVLP